MSSLPRVSIVLQSLAAFHYATDKSHNSVQSLLCQTENGVLIQAYKP